jgi:hypothetical protein
MTLIETAELSEHQLSSIYFDKATLLKVERARHILGMSRSSFVMLCVRAWLRESQDDIIEAGIRSRETDLRESNPKT